MFKISTKRINITVGPHNNTVSSTVLKYFNLTSKTLLISCYMHDCTTDAIAVGAS